MCLPSSIFFFVQQANLTIGSPTIEGSILEYRVLPLWPTYIYWKEDNICQSIWDDKSQLLWRTCWGNTLGNHQVLVHNRQNWSLIFSLIWTWSLLTTLSVAILWAVFLLLQFCSVAHTQQRLFFFSFFFFCFNSNSFAKACTSSKELPMLSLLLWLQLMMMIMMMMKNYCSSFLY